MLFSEQHDREHVSRLDDLYSLSMYKNYYLKHQKTRKACAVKRSISKFDWEKVVVVTVSIGV